MNNLVRILGLPSLSKDKIDFSNVNNFFDLYRSKELGNDDTFDISVLKKYRNDPAFIEKQLLELIIKLNDIDIEQPEFFKLQINKMIVNSITSGNNNGILVDELLTQTLLSFFLTIFSFANDSSGANFSRCFENFLVTLEVQGRRKKFGFHGSIDYQEMMCMPLNVLNLSCDAYWCAISFIIGHELYHLTHKDEEHSLKDETNADRFGYRMLINMIEFQKKGKIPKELEVFSESLYLSPVMFLEYFRLYNEYLALCGINSQDVVSFSPKYRECLITEEFYSDVPDSFNTEIGNDLLNIFLDADEELERQLKIKLKKGKLNSIINQT